MNANAPKTIRQMMAARPQAPYCSGCEAEVPKCHRAAKAVVCWRCTTAAADGHTVAAQPARACPDCGKPVESRQRYCPKCRRTRRQTSIRAARDSKRENAYRNTLETQGLREPKTATHPPVRPGQLTVTNALTGALAR